MPLPPSEILSTINDDASDKLLWLTVSRYISLIRYNPAELGSLTGADGDYTPTDKETELAKQDLRQPGRYRTQILTQVYANINTLLAAAESTLGPIDTRSALMDLLGDGSLEPYLFPALSQFAAGVAGDLIPDEDVASE